MCSSNPEMGHTKSHTIKEIYNVSLILKKVSDSHLANVF
jgi:hypothetical protein